MGLRTESRRAGNGFSQWAFGWMVVTFAPEAACKDISRVNVNERGIT